MLSTEMMLSTMLTSANVRKQPVHNITHVRMDSITLDATQTPKRMARSLKGKDGHRKALSPSCLPLMFGVSWGNVPEHGSNAQFLKIVRLDACRLKLACWCRNDARRRCREKDREERIMI